MPLAVVSYLEFVAIFIILGWAIYIVYRAGQLYMAPVFTMTVGAYTSAYLARDLDWPFGLALIAAVGLGAVFTFLPALGLARVPSFAAAISTVALIFIGQAVFRNLEFLGGARGYFNVPDIEYLLPLMYMTLVIVGFFIYRLDHSHLGRAMEAVFTNPDLAASLGVSTYKLRLFLHVAAGAMGALAGAFYAFSVGFVHPYSFGFSIALFLVVFIFVGGYATMWGLVIFTPILWAISVFLPDAIAIWKDVIYGVLLIAILILRPDGVIDKKVIRAISTKSQAWLGQWTILNKLKARH